MKYRAFLFDLDGVITSSSREHFDAWRSIAADLGFDLPDDIEESTKGVSRMDSLQVVLEAGNMVDRFTPEEKESLASRKNTLYVNLISEFTPDKLLPGVLELLDHLKTEKTGIALASASKNGPLLLKRLSIGRYFDVVVDPGKVQRGKPAPDIFLEAARALEVPPESCVGIEDALAGVEAVKKAGMFAIGIGEPEVLGDADVVYPDCSYIMTDTIQSLMNRKT